MTTRKLGAWLGAALGWLALVILLDSTGVLSDDAAVVVDDAAQLIAGLLACGLCLWTAQRVRGPERHWRVLMGIGFAGWSIGQAFWSYYQIFSDTGLPSPSAADIGYLTMPVFALPALLSLAVQQRSPTAASGRRRAWLVFTLDGLLVVGSLFILTWSTALGSVVHNGAPSTGEFVVAIAYPATDLALVVMVVLLAVTRWVPERLHLQLWLLGAGLVGISASDSIFAYLVSSGADVQPPATNAGFIAGPLLVAIAALAMDGPTRPDRRRQSERVVDRAYLFLPYALVALTGAVLVGQSFFGVEIDAVEAWVAGLVFALVLARQMVTLVENNALLERVSAAQTELAFRAQHDPLTGLANRTLFAERLVSAMSRHREQGRRFALVLVDLDDFKAINDLLGHAAGDRLLQAVGDRLRHCVRTVDTVARLGGDEFAVVLEGTVDTPERVGERILSAMRHPFHIDGRLVTIGASLGLVEPAPDEIDLTADALMRRADGAMYVGKHRGKGLVVRYRPDLMAEIPGERVV
jgi:diguanylate cyclase (GGDEF)-like protein